MDTDKYYVGKPRKCLCSTRPFPNYVKTSIEVKIWKRGYWKKNSNPRLFTMSGAKIPRIFSSDQL